MILKQEEDDSDCTRPSHSETSPQHSDSIFEWGELYNAVVQRPIYGATSHFQEAVPLFNAADRLFSALVL